MSRHEPPSDAFRRGGPMGREDVIGKVLRDVDALVTERMLDLNALCRAAHDACSGRSGTNEHVRRLLTIACALLDDVANDVNAMAEEVGCNDLAQHDGSEADQPSTPKRPPMRVITPSHEPR